MGDLFVIYFLLENHLWDKKRERKEQKKKMRFITEKNIAKIIIGSDKIHKLNDNESHIVRTANVKIYVAKQLAYTKGLSAYYMMRKF